MRHLLLLCILPLVLFFSVARSDEEEKAVDNPVSLDLAEAEPQGVLSRTRRQAERNNAWRGGGSWGGGDWGNNWGGNNMGWNWGGNWGGDWGDNDMGWNWGGNWGGDWGDNNMGWNWGGDWGDDDDDWNDWGDNDWNGNWIRLDPCRPPRGCYRCKYVNSQSPTKCKNFCLNRSYCFCRK